MAEQSNDITTRTDMWTRVTPSLDLWLSLAMAEGVADSATAILQGLESDSDLESTISPPVPDPQFWTPANCHPGIKIVSEKDAHHGYYLVATEQIEPGTQLIQDSDCLIPLRPHNLLHPSNYISTLFDQYLCDYWRNHPIELLECVTLLITSKTRSHVGPGTPAQWMDALTRVRCKRFPKHPGFYFRAILKPNSPPPNFSHALIHHSCEPNADIIRKQSHVGTGLYSIRRIEPSEKITLNYLVEGGLSWYAPKRIRDKDLKSNWNISSCNCNLCLDKDKSNEIDEKVSSFPDLDQQLESVWSDMSPDWYKTFDVRQLLRVYRGFVFVKSYYPHHYLLFRFRSELIRRTRGRMSPPPSNTQVSTSSSTQLSDEDQWLEIVRDQLKTLGQHFLNPPLLSIHAVTIQRILKAIQLLDQCFDISKWTAGTELRKKVFILIFQFAQTYLNDPLFRQLYCSNSTSSSTMSTNMDSTMELEIGRYSCVPSPEMMDIYAISNVIFYRDLKAFKELVKIRGGRWLNGTDPRFTVRPGVCYTAPSNEISQWLIENSAPVKELMCEDSQDELNWFVGSTVLHLAVKSHSLVIVRYLLSIVDESFVMIQNPHGKTAEELIGPPPLDELDAEVEMKQAFLDFWMKSTKMVTDIDDSNSETESAQPNSVSTSAHELAESHGSTFSHFPQNENDDYLEEGYSDFIASQPSDPSLCSTSAPNQALRNAFELTLQEMKEQAERVVRSVDEFKETKQE